MEEASIQIDQKSSLASPQSMVSVDPSPTMASVSSEVEEASVKTDQIPSPAKGLLRQGFLGLRTASPSPSLTLVVKEDYSTSSQKMGPPMAESHFGHTALMAAHPGFSGGSSLGAAKFFFDKSKGFY
jgi:hypothetical protein